MLLAAHKMGRMTTIIAWRGPFRSVSCRFFFLSRKEPKTPLLRFAPSPTGHLHLGGLRTALFNHLFANKFGGKWILRIEDTDRKRYVEGSTEAMQNILSWSGLEYTEGPDRPGKSGPFLQSQRLHLYSSFAQRLLDSGKAYRDFRTVEEGKGSLDEAYIPASPQEEQELLRNDTKFTIRLKMPKTTVKFKDLVYGEVTFPYDEATGDAVLIKSDGWPTYHLASVVDDHKMDITHVLRGEEWLPSIPIHLNLYSALGFKAPSFAHLPLLINTDGSKLSKRHADVHVESYKEQGFEPEALINFVALMGYNWHASTEEKADTDSIDTSEVFKMQDMIDKFDPARISHSRATPNLGKLMFLNKQHLMMKIKEGSPSQKEDVAVRLAQMIQDRWPDERVTGYLGQDRVIAMANLFVGRADTLKGLVGELDHLFEKPDWNSEEAQEMLSFVGPSEYERIVWKAYDFIAGMHGRDIERLSYLEAALKDLTAIVQKTIKDPKMGTKKAKGSAVLMKPLRLALTAKKSGPTVAETISLLGQAPTLERLETAMQYLADSTEDLA